MKWIISSLVVLIVLTGCSPQPEPGEPTSPGQQSTPTLEPTEVSSSTPAATITPTPTNTPSPTPTFSPTPTPTPVGFYRSSYGYSLILAPGFELDEESDGFDYLYNSNEGIYFIGGCDPADVDISNDEYLEYLAGSWEEFWGEMGESSREYIKLGDGTHAMIVIFETKRALPTYTVQFIFAPNPMGFCQFVLEGEQYRVNKHSEELYNMLKSIVLTPPGNQGVDRSNALVLIGYDPMGKDLDPALQSDSAADYAGHIFSGLVRLNQNLQIEPDLAESWVISPDGKEYTFTLREGLMFQSGKPLTAEDVRYSWERAADPATGSFTAVTYLGDIIGVKEKLAGEAEQINGLEVIDNRTLKVTLDEAKPYFLAKLTYPTSYIVDKENVESGGKDWAFTPNASGPFTIKEYNEEESLVFERNPNYYAPANLDSVVYQLNYPGSHLDLFDAGMVDIARIGSYDAEEIQDPNHLLNDQLHTTISLCTSMIMLNNTIPPMDDPLVREALVRSINRQQLNEYFSNNMEKLAYTILPPAMPGYREDNSVASFDPQAARSALEESSYYSDLPEIVFTTWGYGDENNPYTDAIINMWRENLGIEIQVEYADPDYFSEQSLENQNQIVDYGWCADYPDPENFLDVLFHTQGGFNVSGYSNSEVDVLLEQARSETDIEKRISLYQQAEKMLLGDFSVIPLDHSRIFVLVNPKVVGYTLTPMDVPLVQLLSLQPEEP